MTYNFGIIFDMDGVLVNSNPAHKEAIHLFCRKHNRETSEEFLRERVYGRTNKEWIPEIFGDLPADQSAQLADEKEALFRDIFKPKMHAIPGLIDFLHTLKTNPVKIAVATSAPKENADFILTALGIEHYFHTVLNSSDVEKGKPEPEIYLKAADRLGCKPSECIVFEDSLAGVEAGLRAGTKVVGVTSTHTREELSNCDKTIGNFTEINIQQLISLFGTT